VSLTIGVLALQGDVREHMSVLRKLGAHPVAVRRPSELAAVDGLILPGGESTTMIHLARSFDLLEPLRAGIADGLPVYGSCAGMILLADRLADGAGLDTTIGGIDITVRRNAFGRQVDSFEEDVAFAGLDGPPLHAVFIRAPWVDSVGSAAEPLATLRTGSVVGKVVAVRQGRLLATSFHPEITGDTRVHELFLDTVVSA
jgi:pyridoxal 5'-phosphate synthase pdxT subunit